ncbi:hypothetical protein J3F80_000586 [Coemansia sp. RSA 2526]|nr:hypothetical protein J3F80_000586 [Coemansia sp. RSA 2526]
MDRNIRPFNVTESGSNSQPPTPVPGGSMQPQDYSFMHALASATSIQQQQSGLLPQYDPQYQQAPHRRSFDLSALQIPVSPMLSNQHQQSTPMFPSAQFPMHDSRMGIVGPGPHRVVKPQSQHNTKRPSSNRSSIGSISDTAPIASPLQEPASLGNAGASDIALLLSGALQVKPNTTGKPPYPYATLITYAILQHPRKQMTLSEIYTWLMFYYPYFKTAGSGWKNSIRHNLSLNKTFMRFPRPINEPGKGAYWTVDLAHLDELLNAKPKPTIHRYSPARSAHHDTMPGPPPIGAGPVPSLTFTIPGAAGPNTNAANPLMTGITSSISDKGLLVEMPNNSAQHVRRSSLQSIPVHRYQPYAMPTHVGLGNAYPLQHGVAAAQQQPLAPSSSLYNPHAMPLAGAQSQDTLGPQPSFPVPFSGATMSMAAGLAIPPSGLMGISTGSTVSAQPGNPTPAFSGGAAADLRDVNCNFGSSVHNTHMPPAASTGRMAAPLSLRTHLQMRPTPSLPDYLMAPPSSALQKDAASPVGSLQGDVMALNSPVVGGAGPIQQGQTAPHGQQPSAPSIGDLSAYFAFLDAQDPSTQHTGKSSGNNL